MLRNLSPSMKAYLGIGGVLILAVLLAPGGKKESAKSTVAPPKPIGTARANGAQKAFLEAPAAVTPSLLVGWSGEVKAREPFKPLVRATPPPAPEPDLPEVPQVLPLEPTALGEQPAREPQPEPEPGPEMLYTGWYRIGGEMVALIENLAESSFHYLREGESLGRFTVVKIEPQEVVLKAGEEETRLAKTNEFVATPLNQNAPNTQNDRGRFAGRFPGGFFGRFPGGADGQFGGGGFPGRFGEGFGGRSPSDRGGGGESDDARGETDNGGDDRSDGRDRGDRGDTDRGGFRGFRR